VAIPNAAFGVPRLSSGPVIATGDGPARPVAKEPAGLVVTAGEASGHPVAKERASSAMMIPAPESSARPAAAREREEVPALEFFRSFGIENHPIEPNVRFEPKAEDVAGNGRGWIEQVEAILNGTPLA
jgi:hypothetical protein